MNKGNKMQTTEFNVLSPITLKQSLIGSNC